MRWKAAVVNAAGFFGGGLAAAKVGQVVAPRLPGSLSLWSLPVLQIGLGAVVGMLSKRGLVQELAHGSLIGGMTSAAGIVLGQVGAAARTPGGA